jgi:hypothetical protein
MAGGENPSHHDIFAAFGVDQVAVNIGSLKRNYWGSFGGLDINVPNVDWVAWSDDPSVAIDDLLEIIVRIGSPPQAAIGPEDWTAHKEYLPIWDGDEAMPLSLMQNGLVITDHAFMNKQARQRALSAKSRNTIIGVITGRSTQLDRFDLAISTSWYNVQSWGETHIWDGHSVRRYSADKKEAARLRHREEIEGLGVDFDDVMADDPQAVLELTMRSWAQLAEHLNQPTSSIVGLPIPVATNGSVAPVGTSVPGGPLAISTQRQRVVLPTMNALAETVEDDQGFVVEEKQMISTVADSVRRCDNCYMAAACPAYNPGHSCAFSLPVEIRTKEQVVRVLQSMLEMDTQRIFQLRFAEEVLGQDLNPEVGREMERFFKMAKLLKDVETEEAAFRVMMEARGPVQGGGIISQLFGNEIGSRAYEANNELPTGVIDARTTD